MGLFSRKPKTPKAISSKPNTAGGDSASVNSQGSNLKSSSTVNSRMLNRTSAGSVPPTPLTPMTPHLPKVNLPKPPDPSLDAAGYLRSLGAVRERSKIVTEKALRNKLTHFDVDLDRFPDVVTFVCGIIKRDYDAPFSSIPGHGRYQHFCVGGRDRIATLLSTFPDNVDNTEKCRRLIDLFLVSVLLDAGAGTTWSFKSAENGRIYKRSEGLAIASLEMFKTGLFSSNPSNKFQVDKDGLRSLTVDQLARGMQSRPGCEVAGLEGRAQLLMRLGTALAEKRDFWGDSGRPGNMIDYLLAHPTTQASSTPIVILPVLWNVLMSGLAPIWPASRTAIDGISLGDAWPCSSMPQQATSPNSPSFSPFPNSQSASTTAPWESILPFHKLTQWLTYSLMQPMQSLLRIQFAGTELLTGLPEYRNGGLFIDLGVMTLKRDETERGLQNYSDYCRRTGEKGIEVAPMFEPSDDVIVEWRGVTVGFLDKLCAEVNKALRQELNGGELTLAQLLEAGSWKGGREIAEVSRPNTKEPPILIDSDGTVF
ncbi:Uu.00g007080.m01.CDS01 [Anthostomella pinea]|uniref:Uu.00g007010.m01.CDS01 n=1 Tax=Anthostomella pinea TaxID=933095 RepID=A0AAI8VF37_9PEZI|nr:Uu.00g007010.m01.CDS01 [Anthostomella pinea]CAJ2506578.1 Uu.00g007080.m01.CDS01 [Anthostomella pinea]